MLQRGTFLADTDEVQYTIYLDCKFHAMLENTLHDLEKMTVLLSLIKFIIFPIKEGSVAKRLGRQT